MEKIRRSIRLFFVQYGKLLFYIIGAIAVVITIIQGANKLAIENNKKREIEIVEYKKISDIKKENKKLIIQFIENCNTGKIEQAYNMVANKCKQEKYSTLEIFKNEYINNVFDISICEYKIEEKNEIFNVTLTQDMLITGKMDSIIKQNFKIEEEVLEKKIYIN